VNQPGYGNGNKCYIYRYRVSDGTGGSVLGPYSSPVGPVCITSDGSTLIVANKDKVVTGNVFVYSINEDSYSLLRQYYKQNATGAYLDEGEKLLYVCGEDSGISVFDYAAEGSDPLFTSPSTQHYAQIRKIGGELYASYIPGCRMLKMTCDKAEGKLTSVSVMPNTGLKLYTGTDEARSCARAYIFSDFSYEDSGAREIAHYKFDEPANAPVFRNSISEKYPMRSYRTQSGAVGVSGGALYFHEDCSHAILEGSRGMIGGDYGIFMWFGCNNLKDTTVNILSNNMKNNNKGRFSLMMDCGKLQVNNTLLDSISITTSEAVLRDGKYHHIGVVKKGKNVSIWIDGEKKGSKDGNVGSLGLDDTMDFVLGGTVDGHDRFMLSKSYFDDLRIFDGAPADDAVKAMYDEYKDVAASLEVPALPVLPTHDSTVAKKYGTVINHSFAHQTPRTPPAVAVQANGDWWVLYGARSIPSSKDMKGSAYKSTDRGSTWINWTGSVYVYHASPFECKEDGLLYALGRTSYDRGNSGYSIGYNMPNVGSDGRAGYSSFGFEKDKNYRRAFFTNEVNMVVLRKANVLEPEIVTLQEIYPGAGLVSNGRFYLSYLLRDKVGLISGAVTPMKGISDFQPEVASVISVAAKPFPGPVVENPDGKISVLVSAGLNGSGVATVNIASRDAIGDELAVVEEGIELPGSDRPFAVKYDPVRRQYWAATTPNGTSLCLYASRNLKEWGLAKTVFTVSDAETTRVSNPSFDISGRDIVLGFSLACPDGGPAVRSLDDPNYVMVRKVQSFRKDSPWQNGTVFIMR
jgi:hypothetical protein